MNNFFKVAIVLALTGITQVASSQEAMNFNQVDEDFSLQRQTTESLRDVSPAAR